MRRRARVSTPTATAIAIVSMVAPVTAFAAEKPLGTREVAFGFGIDAGEAKQEAWANHGSAAVTAEPVSANGGWLQLVDGRKGGEAVDFPSFASSKPGMAALKVVSESGDPLSPGWATFRIGVDFRLDSRSAGSSVDDGNNLLQRGAYGDVAQYKLQVDRETVSCRVKGTRGAVMVSAKRRVETGQWFRVTCTREGNDVQLRLIRLSDYADWIWSGSGAIGDVTAAHRSQPMSIGAKLDHRGEILTRSSDQFNGQLDNAFLNIAR